MFLTICVKRWLQGLIWAYEGERGAAFGRRFAPAPGCALSAARRPGTAANAAPPFQPLPHAGVQHIAPYSNSEPAINGVLTF